MNHNQLMCLWAGVLASVAMGLFPPWTAGSRFAGYRFFLWHPLEGAPQNDPPLRIDATRLLIQWVMVVVLTVGLILTYHGPRLAPIG